jgi:hypothetical protein
VWWVAVAAILPVVTGAATLPATSSAATRSTAAPTSAAGRAATLATGILSKADATTNTLDPYGPAGMNVDAAQSYLASGADGVTPHIEVAYIEGGVNWHESGGGETDLADAMWINWHDTPVPCVGSTVASATMTLNGKTVPCATAYSTHRSDYDINDAGDVTVADWAHDPRVKDANGNGFLDPEDLIAAFSGPGFVSPHAAPAGYSDAISGWDFYNGQNDPATTDASYDHSDDQMNVIHTVCPTCLILPVKAGDEAIDSTEDLAKAWLFAYESGAKVIVSVTADLGYSSFAEQVLSYLDSKGVIVVESSNDFDSADHQGGMFWGNVLPGNGLVPNTAGVPNPSSTLSKMAGPFWTRSDLTSFGVHNMFSVATNGGSTSESTPTLGAVMALVLSEGEEAAAAGKIARPLTSAEATQVLKEASAEPTAPAGATLPWPAGAGEWDEQYGYGMPDVLTALQDVRAGEVPASPEIDSPQWYTIEDPTRDTTVPVIGTVDANTGQTYGWSLQYGLGGDPSTWTTISSGTKTGPFAGKFGTLALPVIPRSFWEASFKLSDTKELTTLDQYDVTFRVTTTLIDGSLTLTGEARRVIDVFHDPSAVAGFPMAIGSSGESEPALVDLQGTGRLDMVFGTANGTIEAIDPATGRELPGWPAHTNPIGDTDYPAGMTLGDQPIISDVAVGDLYHNGQLDVVATSEDGEVYVFDPQGQLDHDWPQVMDNGVVKPAIPRPALAHERVPVEGAVSPPVLVTLVTGPDLDIVQAGWDGEIHAWYPNSKTLPGWPVRVTLTSSEENLPSGYTLEADQKLDTPPAVAQFSRTGFPDLVIRSQYTELGPDVGGLQATPNGFVFAYTAAGKLVPGWPVRLQGTIEDYGSAQEFITEGTDSPSVADALGTSDGNDSLDDVAVGPIWTPNSLVMGSGKVVGTYGSVGAVLSALVNALQNASEAIFGPLPATTPMPFTGSGAFGVFDNQLTFADPSIGAEHLGAALSYAGSGNPINNLTSVWTAEAAMHSGTAAGDELSGFPSTEQGQDFLGQPMFAPVSAGSSNEVVLGGDSGAVDARLSSGAEAPGFPKFTGGWTVYAPSAGDLFGNGHDDLVTVTREGYLFAWSTAGAAPAAGSWWRSFHDEYNSGRLETDSRPPGVVRDGHLTGTTLKFVAPGANWYDGKASSYQVVFVAASGKDSAVEQVADTESAGASATLTVPSGTTAVVIRADGAGGLISNAERCTSTGEVTVVWPN